MLKQCFYLEVRLLASHLKLGPCLVATLASYSKELGRVSQDETVPKRRQAFYSAIVSVSSPNLFLVDVVSIIKFYVSV